MNTASGSDIDKLTGEQLLSVRSGGGLADDNHPDEKRKNGNPEEKTHTGPILQQVIWQAL